MPDPSHQARLHGPPRPQGVGCTQGKGHQAAETMTNATDSEFEAESFSARVVTTRLSDWYFPRSLVSSYRALGQWEHNAMHGRSERFDRQNRCGV